MKLHLARRWLTPESTGGELYIDQAWECFTLEDVVRPIGVKIPGQTAIPTGLYRVGLTPSDRVQRGTLWSPSPPMLPLLLDVPGFEGIRFHAGNRTADTAGCILVGQVRAPDFVGQSRVALTALMAKLAEAPEIWLTITSEPGVIV